MNRSRDDADFGLAPNETFEPTETGAEGFDLSKPHVMTVLGPVDPAELGVCLPHEHLLCNPVAVTVAEPDYRLDDRHAMLAELEAWNHVGGGTVVDASTRDYGRDVAGLHWLALRSPVHIVMVTGRHNALHSERISKAVTAQQLRDEIVREFLEGVGPAGVRPGLIKLGTSLGTIKPIEAMAAIAAAEASLLTGLPVTTHTEAGTMAVEQLDLLEREGLPVSRVILGHLDRRLDEGYLRELLARGAWVSFDQIGKSYYGPDEPKAALLARLMGDGYGGQLLLSMDLARKSLFPAYGGGPGWPYMLERFTLLLLDADLSANDVRRLMVANPQAALTVVSPRTR